MSLSFLGDLLQTITDRGRDLIRGRAQAPEEGDLSLACETLLSSRGEASGTGRALAILDRWEALDDAGRLGFLKMLADRYGPDPQRLARAVDAWRADPGPLTMAALHEAAEPRRQELIRRLNLAPGGIATLVRMREELFRHQGDHPALDAVDADFVHLFSSWFNRGFLVLRRIDWTTPAHILEKIIQYEAVHEIAGWDDLRRRLAPADRRCFGFFHPQLPDEPLIFVEVALTRDIPATIAEVLAEDRTPIAAEQATTAVFYSISNCQKGLRAISFGNFLIKQVVEELRRDLPGLDTFVTLSPVPGFAAWVKGEEGRPAALDQPGWWRDEAVRAEVEQALLPMAARYFVEARGRGGRVIDPVARFHLGNGARLERINFLGDLSPRGFKQAHGLMVNYLYRLPDIEKNHEAYAVQGKVVAAPAVTRLLKTAPKSRRKQG
ncbi:MAG: malonyl-CoA decarboxylase [Ferrovibrionaceae bacterium]